MAFFQPLVLEGGEPRQLEASVTEKIVDGINLIWLFNNDVATTDIGDAMYVTTTGDLKKARADSIVTAKVIFLAAQVISPGGFGLFQAGGLLQTGLGISAGSILFLSPTVAGLLTTTPPTGVGQFIVRIGIMGNVDRLSVNIQPPIKRS